MELFNNLNFLMSASDGHFIAVLFAVGVALFILSPVLSAIFHSPGIRKAIIVIMIVGAILGAWGVVLILEKFTNAILIVKFGAKTGVILIYVALNVLMLVVALFSPLMWKIGDRVQEKADRELESNHIWLENIYTGAIVDGGYKYGAAEKNERRELLVGCITMGLMVLGTVILIGFPLRVAYTYFSNNKDYANAPEAELIGIFKLYLLPIAINVVLVIVDWLIYRRISGRIS